MWKNIKNIPILKGKYAILTNFIEFTTFLRSFYIMNITVLDVDITFIDNLTVRVKNQRERKVAEVDGNRRKFPICLIF